MKKFSTVPPVLLLLILLPAMAVSPARADDIATIRSYLADKTDDAAILHDVYMACLNLTRTGTIDSVPILKQLLDDERFTTVALTALINIPGGLEREIPAPPELTSDAALLASILQDGDQGLFRFLAALSDEKTPFKVLQRAVLELKSEKTGAIVLQYMGNLSQEQQAALIRNLGARKDSVAIVPRLIEIAQGDQPLLQYAAIEALGEIGDVRAVDAILIALGSPDVDLKISATAQNALKQFQGLEFDKKILMLLSSKDKKLQLAALEIVGERPIEYAQPEIWHLLLYTKDAEIRTAAFKAYGKSVEPTTHFISALTIRASDMDAREWTEEEKNAMKDAAYEAILAMCRRATERERTVELFADLLKRQDDPNFTPTDEQRSFYLDCLFQLGGEQAAKLIATVAMLDNDALTDKATQLLGRWTTPEVAPYLIEIAEKHPNERYRVRTFSGYLRVIRQMGLPVEQKVHMAEKALAVAPREADKQAAAQVLERFQAMMKGTPIFDGKTFEGWEFRNEENAKWFRIEDGAIVGGTLEESIPRNEFITSTKEYGDFTLRIECKAIGKGCNGGVQFRSVRAPADGNMPNEMIGYQADMTDDAAYWGALYDESRRNRFLAEPDRALIDSLFRPNDWNEYEIVCKGNNIKLYLNGTLTVDYTETDANIPARGFIGLQIHGGPPSETWYRNIRVEESFLP